MVLNSNKYRVKYGIPPIKILSAKVLIGIRYQHHMHAHYFSLFFTEYLINGHVFIMLVISIFSSMEISLFLSEGLFIPSTKRYAYMLLRIFFHYHNKFNKFDLINISMLTLLLYVHAFCKINLLDEISS